LSLLKDDLEKRKNVSISDVLKENFRVWGAPTNWSLNCNSRTILSLHSWHSYTI